MNIIKIYGFTDKCVLCNSTLVTSDSGSKFCNKTYTSYTLTKSHFMYNKNIVLIAVDSFTYEHYISLNESYISIRRVLKTNDISVCILPEPMTDISLIIKKINMMKTFQ